MKFLIDAQLPPLLSHWLLDQGAQAAMHINELQGGLRFSDDEVWQAAKDNGNAIVTKDQDFYELSALYGSPPQMVLVRYGNCSNSTMLNYLANAWPDVKARLTEEDTRLVRLTRTTIEIHRV